MKALVDHDEEFSSKITTIDDDDDILDIFLFALSGPLSTFPCHTLRNRIQPWEADHCGLPWAFLTSSFLWVGQWGH